MTLDAAGPRSPAILDLVALPSQAPDAPGSQPPLLEVGQNPVTQQLFETALGYAPSHFGGSPRAPVESVSFHEAAHFCNMASRGLGLAPGFRLGGEGRDIRVTGVDLDAVAVGAVRLLTAEEWEWACLAGNDGEYWWGSSQSSLDTHAWWRGNSSDAPVAIGALGHTNAWGLSDMIGNVWEWCMPSQVGDTGIPEVNHPWKGGSWHTSNPSDMVSSFDIGSSPEVRTPGLGFRIARSYLKADVLDQSSRRRPAAASQVNNDR